MTYAPAAPDAIPHRHFLDRWLRRFGRLSHLLAVLLIYLVAAAALVNDGTFCPVVDPADFTVSVSVCVAVPPALVARDQL